MAPDPLNDRAYPRVALTRMDARRYREALQAYDRALRIRTCGQAAAGRGGASQILMRSLLGS